MNDRLGETIMNKIYPKDIEIKHVKAYMLIAIIILSISIGCIFVVNKENAVFELVILLLLGISITMLVTCITYYVYTFFTGYKLEGDAIVTKGTKITLSSINAICICYGFNTHTRVGPIKIRKKISIKGKSKKIDCLWISIIGGHIKKLPPNMTNMDVYQATGEDEIYGFAVFDSETIASFLTNYKGIYYIPSDIYEKYKNYFEIIIEKYNISLNQFNIMRV